jgi:two-component system OmpR family response regulator
MIEIPQNNMRLLLVEDEPDLLTGLTRALRKQGYSVDTSADGEEGLYKAKNTDYDAIILDVMLPRMDGWEVLKKLRASKETPVLMLTARDTSADRVRGLDGGADDYLTKPFDIPELLARIRVIIRRGKRHARSWIEIGEIKIDTAARTVMQGQEKVVLTAREYNVLEYLAMHRGEIVTRTDLYEHLFEEEDSTFSNLIDVHVFNLRKRFGRDFIVTRRGLGYCIE